MNENTTLNIATIIAPILASRDLIVKLKLKIEKLPSRHIQLDFAQVEFISRSAAHELLLLKESLTTQSNTKTIEFISTNDEVTNMLRTVASNRAVPKKTEDETVIKTVSINDLESSPSPLQFLKRLFVN